MPFAPVLVVIRRRPRSPGIWRDVDRSFEQKIRATMEFNRERYARFNRRADRGVPRPADGMAGVNDFPFLSVLTAAPLVGALVVALVPRRQGRTPLPQRQRSCVRSTRDDTRRAAPRGPLGHPTGGAEGSDK